MDHSAHNKLGSFIWNIADYCLRDLYVRGKYRDVILPMVVLRRLDTLLMPTKGAVLEEVRLTMTVYDSACGGGMLTTLINSAVTGKIKVTAEMAKG